MAPAFVFLGHSSFQQTCTASVRYIQHPVCMRAHSFPHSDTYTDPQPSWLSCTELRALPPPEPPLPFPCIFTHRLIYKCNTHASSPLTHACMRAHFLSLPSLSFPCLSQTHPLPGVKLCCRSGSCGVQCVSLAFLASVSPPPPALHTVALNSFVFFFCLVNKCVRSTPHCSGAVVCG